jgi:hypothetical protein
VDAYADPDRPVTEGALRLSGGPERVGRSGEGDEERVSLCVDLHAAVPLERVAERPPVPGQRLCVGVAELVQQPRRPFDVGEEKRDGA